MHFRAFVKGLEKAAPDLRKKLEYLNILVSGAFDGNVLHTGGLVVEVSQTADPVAVEGIMQFGMSSKYKNSQLQFPSQPQSVEYIMERRLMKIASSLLDLPYEILMMIIQHLDVSDLAKLALLNRDFWQLSRSHQSIAIRLDYDYRSIGFLIDTRTELKKRASGEYGGLTKFPSLGNCVRGI